MGGNLVTIVGTGFALPSAPPATGPVPPASPTVEVYFGPRASPRVMVVSSTRCFAVVPKGTLVDGQGRPLADLEVDVVLRNLDTAGALVAGETVTLVDGYEYHRPDISGANPSPLSELVRYLLRLLKSEVTPNVSHETDTDYDLDPTTPQIDRARLPAIAVLGPDLTENRFFAEGGYPVTVDLPGGNPGEVLQQKRYQYDDVQFDIVGYSDNDAEFLNLLALMQEFVDRNTALEFAPRPAEPNALLRLEFGFADGGQFRAEKQRGTELNSNLKVFRGQVVVEGLPRLGIPGVVGDKAACVGAVVGEDGVQLQRAEQSGDTLPASPYGRRSPPPR